MPKLPKQTWISIWIVVYLCVVSCFILLKDLNRQPNDNLDDKVVNSVNFGSFEDAWVQAIDFKNGLVEVSTVSSKVDIVFLAGDWLLKFLEMSDSDKGKIGWILSVTFDCVRTTKDDCDFKSPYVLYVAKRKVRAVQWRFSRYKELTKKALVHHGPGDDMPYKEGLMLDMDNSGLPVFIQLKIVSHEDVGKISEVKRGDIIDIVLPEEEPYTAYVNGVRFDIIALMVSKEAA